MIVPINNNQISRKIKYKGNRAIKYTIIITTTDNQRSNRPNELKPYKTGNQNFWVRSYIFILRIPNHHASGPWRKGPKTLRQSKWVFGTGRCRKLVEQDESATLGALLCKKKSTMLKDVDGISTF